MFRILTQSIWRPFGTLRDNFHMNFHTNFHTNFTQFSHPGRGGHLEPFWACPGGGQPSSPALRFAWISGPLLQPPGRTPGQDARGATHHETSRTQPSTTFRLRGNLLQNGATDVVAASGTSAKMLKYHEKGVGRDLSFEYQKHTDKYNTSILPLRLVDGWVWTVC